QGQWAIIPAIILVPFLWRWPIAVALGGVACLLPFEGITRIGGEERGLMSLAFVASMWVVFAVGIVSGRLRRPPGSVLWCGAFISWIAASALWAVRPDVSLERLSTVIALFLFFFVVGSFRISHDEFAKVSGLVITGGVAAALYSLYQLHNGI